MRDYTLTHLSDDVLLRDLATLVSRDRATTATLLAHIAEVDARRLYVPAGYPSMHAYCVDELRLSEDAAYKRITAARAARRFSALFSAIAEGRLHLAAVSLLAPHLTPENAEELIEAATHRRKSEIEEFLALRFTVPELPARARAVSASIPELVQLAPGRVDTESPTSADEHAAGHLGDGQVRGASRFLLQLTITKDARNKLRYAQELLSHAVPNGDTAQVFERALTECSRTEGATLEERLRAALKFLPRRSFGGTSAGGSEHAPPT